MHNNYVKVESSQLAGLPVVFMITHRSFVRSFVRSFHGSFARYLGADGEVLDGEVRRARAALEEESPCLELHHLRLVCFDEIFQKVLQAAAATITA